jgi:hypothetical protein
MIVCGYCSNVYAAVSQLTSPSISAQFRCDLCIDYAWKAF